MAKAKATEVTRTTNPNLHIWGAVEKTDPKYTKPAAAKGFKCTAINPCYVTKKLTELFGPCGQGWRFVLIDQNFMQGHVISPGIPLDSASVAAGVSPAVHTVIHIVLGRIDYKVGDEWCQTGPQYGQTTFVGQNSKGIFTDEEAPKKSITDCLGKCAALLGVSADIYLGTWDANKYVNTPAGVAHAEPPSKSKADAKKKKEIPVLDPACIKYNTPEQWDDYIETIRDGGLLVTAYDVFRQSVFGANATDAKLVAETTAQVARDIIKKKDSVEWAAIVKALKEEKAKLDAATV